MVVRVYITLVYFVFLHILVLYSRCGVNKDMDVRSYVRASLRASVRVCVHAHE